MSDSKLQSLSEIFNNKIFRIPDFQRGYSWEERQLDDFWEDIQNLSSDKIHYIGLLTVEPIKNCDMQNVEKWKDDRKYIAQYNIGMSKKIKIGKIIVMEYL